MLKFKSKQKFFIYVTSNAKVVGILLVCALISSLAFSSSNLHVDGATTMQELEEKMEKIQQDIQEAQTKLAESATEISLIHQLIGDDELVIAEYNTKIMQLDNEITAKNEEILETEEKLNQTIEKQNEYYKQAKERMKIVYEYGSGEYLEVLLESKSASDFLNRLEYLTKLVEYDDSMLDNLEDVKNEIQSYENKLNMEKNELDALLEENAREKNEIQKSIDSKKETLENIENDQQLLKEQLEAWEAEQIELDEKIQEYIRLYSDSELLYGDGKLSHPTPGYTRISSVFGPRIHPVYGYASNHTGIDLPAPYGTDIKVSASGIVIFSGWGNAYGNYILVDHGINKDGDHIITQYAHCSSLLVDVEDRVVRGDVIAKVGSTGWSTGNHLHYGVQIGGTWVDPEDWLFEYN